MVASELIKSICSIVPKFHEATVLVSSIEGELLSNLLYDSPFRVHNQELLPLLPSDHVGSKQGTGLVHIGEKFI